MQMDAQNIYRGGETQAASPLGSVGTSVNRLAPLNLLRIVFHRWLVVVLFTILGGLAGVLYVLRATPVFEAEAQMEMSVRRPRVINNEAVLEDSSGIRDTDIIFNTRFAKFKSPAMEQLVTQEYFKTYPRENALGRRFEAGCDSLALLIRDVSWRRDSRANIVHVSYESTDPEFAAQLVNVMTHCAGVLMMQENQALSDEAVKWLVEQVEEQRESLEEVEGQLAVIRKELLLDSLEQRRAALEQSLLAVSQEKEGLISRLASRRTVCSFVLELKETDPNLEMLPTGLPKEEQLAELIQEWRAANNELLSMADRYTEIHPEYRKAKEKEARARKRSEQFIDLSYKAVLNEIDLLEKQVEQVDSRIEKIKNESLKLGTQLEAGTQRLQRLERKRDATDNAYQTMLRRMEEARLSADEDMAYTKVIRDASVPQIPVSPQKMKAVATSIFLGLLAGCGLAIVLAFGFDRVEAVSDLRAFNLNILGSIPPQGKMDSRGELATIGLRDSFSHIVEIFAGINSLVSSDKYIDRTKVLLLNSAMPGEGKTISACNLAISSALNGARTLLIDGDLRRPQLANIFNVDDEHPSLLEWLSSGGSSLGYHQLVCKGIIENMDVITSRPLGKINPAELLGRGQLVELLNWAREHYDRIIIDSPPIGPVGDAQVLANHADSVIVVSRIGKTRRRALKFALARFREIDAHVLGCIANDVPHSLSGLFGGAEGYGYAYGYGKGYKSYGRDEG